jgi:hypothetical protein
MSEKKKQKGRGKEREGGGEKTSRTREDQKGIDRGGNRQTDRP